MDEFKMGLTVVGIAVLFVLSLVLAVAIPINIGESWKCHSLQQLHGDSYDFHWELITGCLVQTPSGRWIDADRYLQLEVLEED